MTKNSRSSQEKDLLHIPAPHPDLIQDEIQKILASPEFTATKQQRKFLVYVVNETLVGRADSIKGYTVATQVFGRDDDFDASCDPIVSIQANKLRRALERYYLLDGKFDPIVIDIPKGTYVPTFSRQTSAQYDETIVESDERSKGSKLWPILQITPFKNNTGDAGKNYIGTGISAELAIAISQFDNFRVCYARENGIQNHVNESPRFILEGEIYQESETIKLLVYLIDATTHLRVWNDICLSIDRLPDLYSFKDRVVHVIASRICGEFGVLPHIIRKETKHRPPRELATHEAILRYWEYEQLLSPDSFQRAFEALTYAVEAEPDCSQTLVSFAILYCTIYNLDIEGFKNPLGKASFYAEKAALLNPNNQRVLTGLAYARMTAGELSSAINEARQALELNSESLFMLDGIAWLLTLCGEWELGPELAQKAIKLNPYHREIAHDALWVNYLRKGEYDLAYVEACSRKRYSTLFWNSLIRASTCGLMGKNDEGAKFVNSLLQLRPDFPANGRMLINKYIKFEDISEKILTGLQVSGLKIYEG